MFLNFTHPPPPSKQCEKGKESSYWVGRFKAHECLFGQKNNCVNRFGTEWNWSCLLDLIQLETLLCFLFCSPQGSSVYPQTQNFPFDCSLGFRMVGGDSSSHRGYNTSICWKGQDSLWSMVPISGGLRDVVSMSKQCYLTKYVFN